MRNMISNEMEGDRHMNILKDGRRDPFRFAQHDRQKGSHQRCDLQAVLATDEHFED